MMRKTSQDRHPPRENVRSAHEGCVKDVSVDLSGMSPRVHTLSRWERDLKGGRRASALSLKERNLKGGRRASALSLGERVARRAG